MVVPLVIYGATSVSAKLLFILISMAEEAAEAVPVVKALPAISRDAMRHPMTLVFKCFSML
ncbi:hypothetical protein D3C75_1335490 [compost metagenome]